jgi:hypothetical protein
MMKGNWLVPLHLAIAAAVAIIGYVPHHVGERLSGFVHPVNPSHKGANNESDNLSPLWKIGGYPIARQARDENNCH